MKLFKSSLLTIGLIIATLILHLTVSTKIQILGIVPNTFLIAIILISIFSGLERSLIATVSFIIINQLLTADSFLFLTWLLIPFIINKSFEDINQESQPLQIAILFLLFSFSIELLNSIIHFLMPTKGLLTFNYWIFILGPILNTIIGIGLFFLLNFLAQFNIGKRQNVPKYHYGTY